MTTTLQTDSDSLNHILANLDDFYGTRQDRLYKRILQSGRKPDSNIEKTTPCFYPDRKFYYPTKDLKVIHHKIASYLSRIAIPEYVHSSKKDCSYITNAKAHLNTKETFTTEIQHFFNATSKFAVFKFFRNQMQCSHKVANLLAEICTYKNELPAGSQMSLRLAYFANQSMFDELHQLAEQHQLIMTVYVHKLTFSGNKIPKGFKGEVAKITHRYGHKIDNKNTHFYTNYIKQISGLAIDKNSIKLTSTTYEMIEARLQLFYDLIEYYKSDKITERKFKATGLRLLGHLEFASQFDNKYKKIRKEVQNIVNNPYQEYKKRYGEVVLQERYCEYLLK